MNQIKTSTKQILLAVITSVLMVLMGAGGIFDMHHMADAILHDLGAAKTENRALVGIENANAHFKFQVQEWKDILIRGNDPASFDKYSAQFVEQEKVVQESLTSAIGLMKECGIATDEMEKLRKDHAELGSRYREALNQFDQADPNAGKLVDKLVKGMDRETGNGMEKVVANIEKHFSEHVAVQIEQGQASYELARNIFTALVIAGLVITISLFFAIQRDLMGQLGGEPTYAAEVARRIAARDLTISIETRPGDNSSLLAAMKQMRDSLHEVISQVRSASVRVADDASKMSVASHQVSAGSDQQSDAAASMAAAVEEITVSIQHVASNAGDARNMAAEAGTLSREGDCMMKSVTSEIKKISDAFNHSSQLISSLGEQSGKISAIVNVIKDIADQTNLLALNAAIEAARAGEQGRGFAVVADEVRKLAERTSSSTREIADMIQAIQNGTQSAMQGMSDGSNQVDEGVRVAAKAGDSMTHIEVSSQNVLDAVSEISSALQEQSSTCNLIAKNVEKIAQMTEENSAAVKEVNHAAEQLKDTSGTLNSLVSRFNI